ncbi:nucleotide sugar dehydrogenase [Microbacterium trichothecenolyticum]|uniref:nucleotide sugar dehydrogenase n=1 Tax=Microbacterium trichothecenolyticum TaxID=69370 RepID=UPI001C6EF568|nr:nucleotide sugar dehydrogenase [Microbacterium trichothecenolyticum]MBW9119441.1 nucleotide sugar dehydrogenase [Microbacterium trichothecenolyticum]
MSFENDVVVVGGGGHVGLPLAIALASRGKRTVVYDLSESAVARIREAKMPFIEPGADDVLEKVVADGMLTASTDPAVVASAENVVVVIGTPVDEHLNPDPNAIPRALATCAPYFRDGQLLALRSTIYPGVTALVRDMVKDMGLDVDVAFCPERIAEHKAMTELFELPQIVSGYTPKALARAGALFGSLTDSIVELTPEEAELAKLFTNTWRYIKFAAVNQFYMMANSKGVDFERVRAGLTHDYPRAQDMPGPGFAAGPCLFKDTMQLAAFSDNTFQLGHSAMLVNEGLPLYIASQLDDAHDLSNKTVGILGMAFKAGSDDIRSSLSYKLQRVLRFKAHDVIATDPYVPSSVDSTLLPLEDVLERADILIVATPHSEYRDIATDKPIADVWNLMGNGVLI